VTVQITGRQLTVHLLPRLQEVLGVTVGHKTVPSTFVGVLVADDLGFDKGREARAGKGGLEGIVRDGRVEVADEQSEVGCERALTENQQDRLKVG
jgi:hypothetical protein